MAENSSKFRVIIVGAGPVGLYLAHALQRASVPFIVLEQQSSVATSGGQLIFTWPQTVRLLDQLGLYEQVKEVGVQIREKKRIHGGDGHIMTSSRFWLDMKDNHSYPFLLMPRGSLINILYTSLSSAQNLVKLNSHVTNITHNDHGVSVQLSNGTVEHGSIVIGADGVHSATRASMLAAASRAGVETKYDENVMVANFHGIFGTASNEKLKMEEGVVFESRGGGGTVIQAVATPDLIYYVTLKSLDRPSTDRIKYSREEMEDYARDIGDVMVAPEIQFRELWQSADKSKARKLNQEEGLLRHWSWGRTVLVGDSVCKTTSVNGLGLTCGIHSAVVLANELSKLSVEKEVGLDEIGRAFERYQKEREGEAKQVWSDGRDIIRNVTSRSWTMRFWDDWVLPWVDMEKFWGGKLVSWLFIRHGQILQFVPFVGEAGNVDWVKKPNVKGLKFD